MPNVNLLLLSLLLLPILALVELLQSWLESRERKRRFTRRCAPNVTHKS